MLDAAIPWANTLIWDHLLIYVLPGAGVSFTIRTRILQFRRFGYFRLLALAGKEQTSWASAPLLPSGSGR
jgi:Na+/alanine symporter